MKKKDQRIYQEDIADLERLVNWYAHRHQFAKASECQRELEEFRSKLKESRNGNKSK